MTNSITSRSKRNLRILLSHVYMMIGVKCRQYYVLFSDSHQIMSRSEPESSDFIFLCLLILYFNHFAHYFPIFVDLESIEISFHNHITLLFTINFIQSLTTWFIIQRCCFWYILSISMHTKNRVSYNMSWRFMYQS